MRFKAPAIENSFMVKADSLMFEGRSENELWLDDVKHQNFCLPIRRIVGPQSLVQAGIKPFDLRVHSHEGLDCFQLSKWLMADPSICSIVAAESTILHPKH